MTPRELWIAESAKLQRKSRETGCTSGCILSVFCITGGLFFASLFVGLLMLAAGVQTVEVPLDLDLDLNSLPDPLRFLFYGIVTLLCLAAAVSWMPWKRIAPRLNPLRAKSFRESPNSGPLMSPPEDRDEIVAEVAALSELLGIPSPVVQLAKSTSGQDFPYAVLSRSSPVLLIPAAFLSWRSAKPEAAKALLARELARLAQENPRGTQWSRFAAQIGIFGVLYTLIQVAQTVTDLYSSFSEMRVSLDLSALTSILFLVIYFRLVRYRHASEYLADLGAASAVGFEPIMEAVRFAPEKPWFQRILRPLTHPSRGKRMKWLAGALARTGGSAD